MRLIIVCILADIKVFLCFTCSISLYIFGVWKGILRLVSDFDPTVKLIRPRKTLLKCLIQHDTLEFSGASERASFLCDKTDVQILELNNLTASICEVELHGTFLPPPMKYSRTSMARTALEP